MKVGMIFECGPTGADQQVCCYLAKKIVPGIQISSVTLDNKPKLIAKCGEAAAQLRQEGCQHTFIIWDLYPAWREDGARPCRSEDRNSIITSLKSSRVPLNFASLVCIREELEAWLLTDGRALSSILSRPTHSVRIQDQKNPDSVKNPKATLRKHFTRNGREDYTDLTHALKILQTIPDFQRLRKSISFNRFETKLNGIATVI